MDVFTNEEVVKLADDPLVKMGRRVSMSDARLNGTQVWARALHDGRCEYQIVPSQIYILI